MENLQLNIKKNLKQYYSFKNQLSTFGWNLKVNFVKMLCQNPNSTSVSDENGKSLSLHLEYNNYPVRRLRGQMQKVK